MTNNRRHSDVVGRAKEKAQGFLSPRRDKSEVRVERVSVEPEKVVSKPEPETVVSKVEPEKAVAKSEPEPKAEPEEVEAVPEKVAAKAEPTEDAKQPTSVRRMRGEVASMPKVHRDNEGAVSSMSFEMKVAFKGTIEVRAKGDLATAYWSITPGMTVWVEAVETGDKTYRAEGMDLISASTGP